MLLSPRQLSVIMITNLVILLFWDIVISSCPPQLLGMYFVNRLAYLCLFFFLFSVMGPSSTSGWLGVLVLGCLPGPFVHRLVLQCTFAYFHAILISSSYMFFCCAISHYCCLVCSLFMEVFLSQLWVCFF